MSECRLIAPHAGYEQTHRSFVSEFAAHDEHVVPWIAAEPYTTFRGYVARVEAAAQGIGTEGFVPELLRATLAEARSRGLRRIRVTCDENNEASAKTILRNGGVLEETAFMPEHSRVVARYWIDL